MTFPVDRLNAKYPPRLSYEPFGNPAFDTLIVSGGNGVHTPSPALVKFVRKAAVKSRRIASICTTRNARASFSSSHGG